MLAGLKKISYVVLAFLFLSAPHAALAAGKITVAAAANLSFALKEIGASFEKDTGIRPVVVFGSTVNLTRQIEEGAPFDVFLAADRIHVEKLKKEGAVLPDTATVYASGIIVVAWNRSLPGKVTIMDLADPRIRKVAIANPAHAPYGIAAMEALKKAGVWDKIKGKIVYGENIRQTLQYIQNGDAEAGIVALSIAGVPEVRHAAIDQRLYKPIDQAAAVLKTTKKEGAARRFIAFLKSRAGKAILRKYGYGTD